MAQTLNLRSIIAAEQSRRQLTDYALAKRADCSAEALRKYLNNERECRSDVLERILAALDLRVTRPAARSRLQADRSSLP